MPSAMSPVINDGLDLVFGVFFDKLRGWTRVIRPMCGGLYVWGQQRGVKDIMNPPRRGEFKLEGDRRDNSLDGKGSLSSRHELV